MRGNAARRGIKKNGARGAPVQAVCWISKPLLVVSSASAMASASFDGIWRSTSLVFWSTSLTTVRLLSGSMENSRPWALACGDLLSLSTAWSSAEAAAVPLTASTVSVAMAGARGVPAAVASPLAPTLLRSGARGGLTAPLEAMESIVMMFPLRKIPGCAKQPGTGQNRWSPITNPGLAAQQGRHAVRQRVGLGQDRGTGLLQDLAARQVGRFRREVGILNPALRCRQVLAGRLQVRDGRGETVLDRTERSAVAVDLVQRRVDGGQGRVRTGDGADVDFRHRLQAGAVVGGRAQHVGGTGAAGDREAAVGREVDMAADDDVGVGYGDAGARIGGIVAHWQAGVGAAQASGGQAGAAGILQLDVVPGAVGQF